MAETKSENLHRLRRLMLAADEARVAELERALVRLSDRISDTDDWLEMLDPVIADALANKISESKEEMAEALAPVMGPALKHQIEEAKDDIADALYPVIGRTIRRSIAESMKQLVKTVNDKVDKALSFQSLFRKMKSKVAGVSAGELALAESLPLTVHEVFLIHKQSGILLNHVSSQANGESSDQEIIGGMLTAIRDFAKTAFQSGQELSNIRYEDLQIYLEDGRHAYLAVVCTGVANDEFLARLKLTERRVHSQFYRSLRNFDGDVAAFQASRIGMAKLLHDFGTDNEPGSGARRVPIWPAVVLLLLAAGAAFYYTGLADKTIAWFRARPAQPAPLAVDAAVLAAELTERLQGKVTSDLAGIRFVVDGQTLALEGQASSAEERIVIGHTVANLSPARIILNNLNVAAFPLHQAEARLRSLRVQFAADSGDLAPGEMHKLREVVTIMKTYDIPTIYLTGHTDGSGNEALNLQLSRNRAEKVRQHFIENGIAADQIVIAGLGASEPLGNNATPEGQQLNRRVEFSLNTKDTGDNRDNE